MLLALQIAVVLGGVSMLFMKRPVRISWLLVVCILFTEVKLDFMPLMFKHPQYFTILMLIISELRHFKSNIKSIVHSILAPFILVSLIGFVIHFFTSPHYNDDFAMGLQMFIFEEIGYYFVPAYAFVCIVNERSLKPIAIYVNIAIFILTFVGVLNYLTRDAAIIDLLVTNRADMEGSLYTAGTVFVDALRFRVQALFFNPFDYGYICALVFLFDIMCLYKKTTNRLFLIVGILCCTFGVITCNCRTILMTLGIGLFIFYGLAFKLTKAFNYYAALGLVGLLAYIFVPTVTEKVDHTLSAFTGGAAGSAESSITMRQGQYAAVLYHINNHEWLGRGRDYFNIDLGWGRGGMRTSHDTRLWGLEGVYLRYLLEYGIIGYVIYWITFIILLWFFFKKAKIPSIITATGLSILISFLAFSHMTGELKSPIPTLTIIGIIIKLVYWEMQIKGNYAVRKKKLYL